MSKESVVVLGAGIVGICCAIELQKAGYAVELVDRSKPGSETSAGNAGIFSLGSIAPLASPALIPRIPGLITNSYADFRMHYPHLLPLMPWLFRFLGRCNRSTYLRDGQLIHQLTAASLEMHLALIEQSNANDLAVHNGGLRLYRRHKSFEKDEIERELLQRCGVEYEVVEQADIKSLEPDLSPRFVRALWTRQSVSVKSPYTLCERYTDYFRSLGGNVRQDEVRSVQARENGWSMFTTQGERQVGKLVLCLGAWTPELLKPLGYKNVIAIERGYHMMISTQSGKVLHRPVFDVDRNYVMIPMADGIRVTTGTNLTYRETAPTPHQVERVLPAAYEAFPLKDRLLDEPWMGRRPSTPDSLPLIGPAPRHHNLWLAYGHAHMGLGMGPITGQIIARQVSGEEPPFDVSACEPSRYL